MGTLASAVEARATTAPITGRARPSRRVGRAKRDRRGKRIPPFWIGPTGNGQTLWLLLLEGQGGSNGPLPAEGSASGQRYDSGMAGGTGFGTSTPRGHQGPGGASTPRTGGWRRRLD